jgi:membrane protease YdiL (CAAX protease family)
MHALTVVINLVLASYVIWEVVRFGPQYRQLKLDLAKGHKQARIRVYRQAIVFEWVSALLALLALGFDWTKLNPKFLALEGTRWMQVMGSAEFDQGRMAGLLFGLALGTAAVIVARLRSRRFRVEPAVATPGWLRKLLPDFSALIPSNTHERLLWVAVAISAGVCEEIVFRGWLLSTLHGGLHLDGTALIAIAAALFGLAHSYQGPAGVVLTGLVGVVFCGLYVATGSLLVPIVLHSLIDLRFAVLPGVRARDPQASYA